MGEVTAIVNGRSYTLSCGDGEESRLKELIGIVLKRTDALSAQHGHIADAQLLLMASLLIADELLDAKSRITALESNRRS
jgi:cell division protein ZapA